MQVNQVSNFNNITNSYGQKGKNVRFNGLLTSLGNANKNVMKYLEHGGFFAEFCLMDMCGLVLPRVYQGFNRNKKELGHWNYQAGTEEFLREFITGPSMFIIPIAALLLAGRFLGRGTQINSKLLSNFTDTFKSLGSKLANSDLAKKRTEFAGQLFDNLFTNHPDKINHALPNSLRKLDDFRQEFVAKLTDSLDTKLSRKVKSQKLGAFTDFIANLNTSYFKRNNTLNVNVIPGEKPFSTSAADLYLDARKYMQDIIPCTQKTFDEYTAKNQTITSEVINKTIDGITKLRENGRKLVCLGGTAALAAFLSIIPKIYQVSKKNPALNGIDEKKEVNA